jgi:hypothetical protein
VIAAAFLSGLATGLGAGLAGGVAVCAALLWRGYQVLARRVVSGAR